MKISILGTGWLGLPLAKYLHKKGHSIKASFSNPNRKESTNQWPFDAFQITLDNSSISGEWEDFITESEILIINIPPRHRNKPDLIFSEQVETLIKNTSSETKVILVSSTSVYGTINGLINEEILPQPNTLNGIELLKSENLMKNYFKENLSIIRFAGLIGPQRHPGDFVAGKINLPNPEGGINLIHQNDCIRVIELIISKACFGQVYNACSGEHPKRKDYYKVMTEKKEKTPPSFMPSNNLNSSKIIDNSKSIIQLGMEYTSIYSL